MKPNKPEISLTPSNNHQHQNTENANKNERTKPVANPSTACANNDDQDRTAKSQSHDLHKPTEHHMFNRKKFKYRDKRTPITTDGQEGTQIRPKSVPTRRILDNIKSVENRHPRKDNTYGPTTSEGIHSSSNREQIPENNKTSRGKERSLTDGQTKSKYVKSRRGAHGTTGNNEKRPFTAETRRSSWQKKYTEEGNKTLFSDNRYLTKQKENIEQCRRRIDSFEQTHKVASNAHDAHSNSKDKISTNHEGLVDNTSRNEIQYVNGCRPKTPMMTTKKRTQTTPMVRKHFNDRRAVQTTPMVRKHFNDRWAVNTDNVRCMHADITRKDQSNSLNENGSKRLERPYRFGFPFLKGLREKDASYITLELTRSTDALLECMKRAETEYDLLELLLEVLSIAFTSRSVPTSIISLFEILKSGRFFDTVILYLLHLQPELEEGKESHIVKVRNTLSYLLKLMWSQITRNPSSITVFRLVHRTMGQTIEQIATSTVVDQSLLSDFSDYTDHKNELEKNVGQTMDHSMGRNLPPDNFREIPVLPTTPEIKGQIQPFLRKNKVEGEYDDLEHYLDVQFRLLREDFLSPLRDGITKHIRQSVSKDKHTDRRRNTDIRLYENVRVYAPVINDNGLCYKVQFEMTTRLKRINWEAGKRLIYGSLVCLSEDDFSTFFLATVINNDKSKFGKLVIQLDREDVNTSELMSKTFKMAETTAYFESYKHVLTSLQTFQPGDLPFEQYILFCETSSNRPSYVKDDTTFDLRPLVDDTFIIEGRRRLLIDRKMAPPKSQDNPPTTEIAQIPVCTLTDGKTWPSKSALQMDDSQLRAVKDALTREFAVIQGPPGTGKTYIGLKIAKALLHNKSKWCQVDKLGGTTSPMLIVCYTNHALDQFLEGIVGFFNGDVVRVGGRSKSSVLENHTLKRIRKTATRNYTFVSKIKALKEGARREVRRLSHKIDDSLIKIEIYLRDILHEQFLQEIIGPRHLKELKEGLYGQKMAPKASVIVHWLRIPEVEESCRGECQGQRKEHGTSVVNVEVDTDMKHRYDQMLNDIFKDPERKRNHQSSYNELQRKVSAYFVNKDNQKNIERQLGQLENRYAKLSMVIDDLQELQKKLRRKLVHEELLIRNATMIEMEQIKDEQYQLKCELEEEKQFQMRMKKRLRTLLAAKPMTREEVSRVQHVWRLDINNRWRLYSYWVQRLCQELYTKIDDERAIFKSASDRVHEAQLEEDKEILKLSSVIGMTTTGAAKYQSVLKEIKPRIVIVEEAAEVLEAHIITTLSRDCDHLILIGDHKQLRPNPTVYKLAVNFNMDISLFERMIKNSVPYNCLQLQHRMRPEIANVMRHIYPNLKDHPDVQTYDNVKGVSTNIMFIDHNKEEKGSGDTTSYSNTHEALFAAELCRYLLKQEYKSENITILTTYTGQLFELQKHMPKADFEGVKVTVVDNYQGEENDIVILSLVRSNTENRIGFLKTENRICVALSRAKKGFYVLGNFKHLAAHSGLWKNLTTDMERRGLLSDGLKLYCQNHPDDTPIIATTAEDFKLAPEGGCMKFCKARLDCGHSCVRYCHVSDTNHELYKCKKQCLKSCELGHKCKGKCYQDCFPCDEVVMKTLPKCGHKQYMQCHRDPETYCCQEKPCHVPLQCGHPCTMACGEKHTEICREKVEVTLQSCGHSQVIDCWKKDTAKCSKPCKTELKCRHTCGGTCGSCLKGRFHDQCVAKCGRTLVCGHECKSNCNNCPPCSLPCENRCTHMTCRKRCGEPCDPCYKKCQWECKHYKCKQLCSKLCDRPPCNEPCDQILSCKHRCIGICGEPCPELCRICNADEVAKILDGNEDGANVMFVFLEDCRHVVEREAMDKYMAKDHKAARIQLKGCPRCKKPIRHCVRYGNIINTTLRDIERAKCTIFGDKGQIDKLAKEINQTLERNTVKADTNFRERKFRLDMNKSELDKLKTVYTFLNKEGSSKQQVLTIENQTKIITTLKTINREIAILLEPNELLEVNEKLIKKVEQKRCYMSEQEMDDIKREVFRGETYLHMLKLKQRVQRDGNLNEVECDLARIRGIILKDEILTDTILEELKSNLKDVEGLTWVKIDGKDRLSISTDTGLSNGHWFKCPKASWITFSHVRIDHIDHYMVRAYSEEKVMTLIICTEKFIKTTCMPSMNVLVPIRKERVRNAKLTLAIQTEPEIDGECL